MTKPPVVRGAPGLPGKRGGPLEEELLLPGPFGVARVAGDREEATGKEALSEGGGSEKGRLRLGSLLFVSRSWEVAEVEDDQLRSPGAEEGGELAVADLVDLAGEAALGGLNGSGLDIAGDHLGAKRGEEEGVVAVAAGGVDGDLSWGEELAPEVVGEIDMGVDHLFVARQLA